MPVKQETIALRTTNLTRFALLLGVLVPLALFALLYAATPAPAATLEPSEDPPGLEFEEEFGEGEEEVEEECEEVEELLEECEEAEEEAEAAAGASPPEACLLRTARARVVAYTSRNRIRLTLGYTTYESTAASIEYRVEGGKGSLHLGTTKRRLGRSGVLRLTKHLSDAQMSKVQAAGRFTVRLHVVGAPGSCRRFETEQLTAKSTARSQTVWLARH